MSLHCSLIIIIKSGETVPLTIVEAEGRNTSMALPRKELS
jgi:hypothetical protein